MRRRIKTIAAPELWYPAISMYVRCRTRNVKNNNIIIYVVIVVKVKIITTIIIIA